MSGLDIWYVLVFLIILVFNVLPWILALMSKQVEGVEKLIWFLCAFFISWLGYFVFYFVAVRNKTSAARFENQG